jgi:hypothetical protein
MSNKRKLFSVLIFIIPLIFIFSQCLTINKKQDPRGEIYAGSSTCIQCHKDVHDNYLHTAHFSTTRLADIHNIGGSFKAGSNEYFFNKDTKVVMEKRGNELYQVAYYKGKEVKSARFDITFGSVKAESYLSWQGNEVYQLPMSYFYSLNSWTNSPGYDSTAADFGRMIGKRCFECHSSYIKELPPQEQSMLTTEQFDKNSLILGIDCERCHGPATNHVNYHLAYPEEKKAKYIATYASLTRAQKLDMCAVCHSGNKSQIIRPIFAFKPGDNLADYKETELYQHTVDSTKLDVHGNQNQLLASSKCFLMSKMDCATCHDAHVNERQNLALYSQRCMNCHKTANHNFCPMAASIGGIIKSNCIDCHMPAQSSNIIAIETAGKGRAVPYMVRTHHITVYTDATLSVLSILKKYNRLTSR